MQILRADIYCVVSNALFKCFADNILVGQKSIVAEMPLKVNHAAVRLKMRGQTKHRAGCRIKF